MLILSGCSPSTDRADEPSPEPVSRKTLWLVTTPSARSRTLAWWEAFRASSDLGDQSEAPASGSTPIEPEPFVRLEVRLDSFAIQFVSEEPEGILISMLEPPEGWFATPLGWEGVGVIVHPDNRVGRVSTEELSGIFRGEIDTWSTVDGQETDIQPIIPLAGDEIRTHFESRVLVGARFTPNALLAPDPDAAHDLIEQFPNGIALIPSSQVGEGVRLLPVDGVYPNDRSLEGTEYPLRLPILAIAPQEPDGIMLEFLLWIQGAGARGTG